MLLRTLQSRLSPILAVAVLFGTNNNNNNCIRAFSSNSNSNSNSNSHCLRTPSNNNNNSNSNSNSNININTNNHHHLSLAMSSASSSSSAPIVAPAWDDLKKSVSETPVGRALDRDLELRATGRGGPNVHSKIRMFDNNGKEEQPVFTLYRDHAGWCPYCQKTMLLIEAKEIPINIELVNMRSYGDKPRSFLSKVPNGMLPALEDNRSGNVALDSAYIMEFLENTHPKSEGFKRMVPSPSEQPDDFVRYKQLMRLERELFSWWCTLVFRSEQPNPNSKGSNGSNNGNPASALMNKIMGGGSSNNDNDNVNVDDGYVSPSMRAFVECLETVDSKLQATKGPYFLDYATDHPTMIDFVFASHIERMLASCAYWKGMDLRNPTEYPQLGGVRKWMEALEQHDYYLAFKSDYYTHVKDIPPQYGPGSNGVSRIAKIKANQANILGSNGSNAWKLPLDDDEALQPLFKGIPLPKCVLEAVGIASDPDGSYVSSASTDAMREACQTMAAWKLVGNGKAIAKFCARGGPSGAKNVRKTFGAELADPYAKPDETMVPVVEECLRIMAAAMLENTTTNNNSNVNLNSNLNATPDRETYGAALLEAANGSNEGVAASLAYLRDRIGVPRDLPLASARYLRAYLNWAIDTVVVVRS